MTGEPLALHGCAPTPLASYLKALGVLRLISSPANHVSGEAADPHARGWWENECFHLRTTLSRDALLHFFLHDYAPSPIIAPWNGGSGFYPKDNQDGFAPLAAHQVAERFEHISSAIQNAAHMLDSRALTERPEGKAKVDLVAALRASLPEVVLPWLDATLALSGDGLAYPQLLGTGGNDGRLDFTNNFARRLVSKGKPAGLFDPSTGKPSNEAETLIDSALLGTPTAGLSSTAVGQFAPGAAGGPNATTGYSSESEVNPWDFVLMLEGATAFAGTASRRHQTGTGLGASFPFTVRTVGAGWGGVEAADENDARAEFWAPLWSRPARFPELDSLFGEGRAVLNGRTARDGLDFARAAASLGISRGFRAFERFGFLMRAGKAYLATPIGRRAAASSPGAELVADLDAGGWLERVRRVGRRDEEPGAARWAIKRLEDALFDVVAAPGAAGEVEKALIALGAVAAWLGVSPTGRQTVGTPPPVLSSPWIRRADDGSAEFRIAAALAGVGLPGTDAPGHIANAQADEDTEGEAPSTGKTSGNERSPGSPITVQSNFAPPMAAHLAPLDEKRFFYRGGLGTRRAWQEGDTPPTVVWGAGDLVSNMIAVLERRLVEASIRSLKDKPLAGATAARLADVAAFLSGGFDDARCAALLAGLVWARPTHFRPTLPHVGSSPVPFVYTALKPVFAPNATLQAVGALPGTTPMPVPPGLIPRLRAGGDSLAGQATDAAMRLALTRARASGLPTPFDAARSGARESALESGRMGAGVRADRLAAALLIPIGDQALTALIERAYPGAAPEDDDMTTEDTTNAP